MLVIQLENYLNHLYDVFNIIGLGEWIPIEEFMDDVFSGKPISKPVLNTMKINCLYYRKNYLYMWLCVYCIFILLNTRLLLSTCVIAICSLLIWGIQRKTPFFPHLLYKRVFYGILLVLGTNYLLRSLHCLFFYILCCSVLTIYHCIMRPVTKKTQFYYDERMLYIKVGGNTNDKRDVYINGICELHLQGK